MAWLDEVRKQRLARQQELIQESLKKAIEEDGEMTGVDIEGYLFFPESIDSNESFAHREFNRTKIMSGGEFVTRGQFIPREYSFKTVIDIDEEKLKEYLKIFEAMENKQCRVTSPYMGGMFNAEVNIDVKNPKASPHIIECDVSIKEIVDPMSRTVGDKQIVYPSISTISDVAVKERKTSDDKKDKEDKSKYMFEHEDRYDDYSSSRSQQF